VPLVVASGCCWPSTSDVDSSLLRLPASDCVPSMADSWIWKVFKFPSALITVVVLLLPVTDRGHGFGDSTVTGHLWFSAPRAFHAGLCVLCLHASSLSDTSPACNSPSASTAQLDVTLFAGNVSSLSDGSRPCKSS